MLSYVRAARCLTSCLVVLVAGSALGAVRRVPQDHRTIQEAIDRASPGDTVLVAPGEYELENSLTFRGKDIELRSEAGPEATVIRMSSTPSDPRFATVVVFENQEGKALPATIEGFTITGGSPDRNTERVAYGGGILCRGSAPTIIRCIISGNLAGNGGGVAAVEGASPTLRECLISDNNTGGFGNQGKGGGIACEMASVTLISCRIERNWTPYYDHGGGIYADHGTVKLTSCEIVGNAAAGFSGYHSTLEAQDCRILGNRGHGVGLFESRADLSASVIAGNTYHGLAASGRSQPSLKGCVLCGNVQGALWLLRSATGVLDHSTVAGNVGPAIKIEQSSLIRIDSSIVWENAGGSFEIEAESGAMASFSCLDSPDLWPEQRNVYDDPLFCGWGRRGEVHVDSARKGPGDGTPLDPYSSLAAALDFSLGLSESSPCRRAAADGADMGAPAASCAAPGVEHRLVRLASGNYSLTGISLAHHASLQGSGPETVLDGSVRGLRSGAGLRDVMVTGMEGSIRVERGQAPSIERCAVKGARLHALFCLEGSAPLVTDCTFEECQWGINLQGASPIIERCRITAIDSGGIWAAGTSAPVITDCAIEDNREQGVVASGESNVTLLSCRISRNKEFDTDSELGGGVTVRDSAVANLTGCVIISNRGTGVSCRNGTFTTLVGCTISGNMPQVTEGGGVSFFQGASGLMVNCLVTGNRGGAVRITEGSSLNLVNCTIAHNQGGAVVCSEGGAPSLINCIVREFPQEQENVCGDLVASLTDVDPLFIRPGTFDFTAASENYYEPPNFIVEPGDYRLQLGSPAIDVGLAASAPPEDIEGTRRPCGAGVDLGAYEAGDCRPGGRTFRRGEVSRDGNLDLSDPVAILGYLFLGQQGAVGCEKAADADDNGMLDLSDPIAILNHLFLGGPQPPPPAAACGFDPTPDALGCEAASPCA